MDHEVDRKSLFALHAKIWKHDYKKAQSSNRKIFHNIRNENHVYYIEEVK